MALNSGSADRRLAIHPQRNHSSSLLRKRCDETFALMLRDYEESVGRPIEWALISESGRANKMLLVSVFGEHDPFPFTRGPKGESGSESATKDKYKDKDEAEVMAETKTLSESDVLSESKAQGEGKGEESGGGDEHESKTGGGGRFKGDDGRRQKRIQRAKQGGSGKEDEIPIPVMTETYQIISSSDGEDAGNPKEARKTYTENYPVVATIMNGELEWMCDDPGYAGYEDMTSYFNKNGLSMVDAISFHDHITQREIAALAELDKAMEVEHQAILAEKDAKTAAKKAAKKARQKPLQAAKKAEKKAEKARKEVEEAEKARLKVEKARLVAEHSGAGGDVTGAGDAAGGDDEGHHADGETGKGENAGEDNDDGDNAEDDGDEYNNPDGNSAARKREKAKAKRLRQKQRRIRAEKDEAAQLKAEDEAQEETLKAFYKQHTGEDLKIEDATSRVHVVDHNSKEGALAIAQAKERGYKMFSATKLNED